MLDNGKLIHHPLSSLVSGLEFGSVPKYDWLVLGRRSIITRKLVQIHQ